MARRRRRGRRWQATGSPGLGDGGDRIEVDCVTPDQFARFTWEATERSGPERLGFAVIEDALEAIRKGLATHAEPRRGACLLCDDAADARAWIDGAPTGRGFDFEALCDALRIDPGAIRRGLARTPQPERRAYRATCGTRTTVVPPPVPRGGGHGRAAGSSGGAAA